jgi:DNA polymerase-3 subunit beta
MKFTIGTETLRTAVTSARRFATTSKTGGVPIMATILLQANDDGVVIIGHSLDACVSVSCPAAITAVAAVALSAQRLDSLLRSAESVQTTVETSAKGATIRVGSRSIYRLPTLMAADFPSVLPFKNEKAVTFNIDSDVALSLLRPSVAISDDYFTKPFLCGLFLHSDGDRLTTAATDGAPPHGEL